MAETTVPAKTDEQARDLSTREETRYITPAVDIYETDDGLVVVADVPGVKRDGVDVRVVDGILTIQATASRAREGSMLSQEFALGTFYRQFELPDKIDQEKISADLRNGVLKLTLPKAESVKPKQIEVRVR
ncbi:MAG: Hsp20/alpha crystallin family protein [Candidatus Eiseniibacteriota bacterium]|jgi:HSP20 family molecular chaperone IbpA